MTDNIDKVLNRLAAAENKLKEFAQGRVYDVGTKILYNEKFGVVTKLVRGAEDPTASTLDVRLEDGTVVEGVKVSSPSLQRFRS